MLCTVFIVIKGLPERVQDMADRLDTAMPGGFHWQDFAFLSGETDIALTGAGFPEMAPAMEAAISGRDSSEQPEFLARTKANTHPIDSYTSQI